MQGTWVRSLVRELRSHMLRGNLAHILRQEKPAHLNKRNPCTPQQKKPTCTAVRTQCSQKGEKKMKYRISVNLFFLCPRLQYALLGTASVAVCLPAKHADWTVLIQSFIVSEGGAWNRGMPTISFLCCSSQGLGSKFLISLPWIQCSCFENES